MQTSRSNGSKGAGIGDTRVYQGIPGTRADDDEVATAPLTVINVRSRNNRNYPHRGKI